MGDTITLEDYRPIVGQEVIGQLERLAERLGRRRLVHVNSTRTGGGVAEMLQRNVPLLNQLARIIHDPCYEGSSWWS